MITAISILAALLLAILFIYYLAVRPVKKLSRRSGPTMEELDEQMEELEKSQADRRKKEECAKLSMLPAHTYELDISPGSVCTPCRHTHINEKILKLQDILLDTPWNEGENRISKTVVTCRFAESIRPNDDHRTDMNLSISPTACGHGYFVSVKAVSSFITERYGYKSVTWSRHYVTPHRNYEKRSEIITSDINDAKEEAAKLASELIVERWGK